MQCPRHIEGNALGGARASAPSPSSDEIRLLRAVSGREHDALSMGLKRDVG